jgi:hypothetical protein
MNLLLVVEEDRKVFGAYLMAFESGKIRRGSLEKMQTQRNRQ